MAGRPSPPECIAICAKLGVDLNRHRSGVIRTTDLDWADTIVVMDRRNWKSLRQFGNYVEKIVWLGEMDGAGEIADPYGLPSVKAEVILSRVRECAIALADSVRARQASSAD